MLDNQHLTVLGVLLGLGATVGLSVGFNLGGWPGVLCGILSGILTPLLLALAFRSRRTRYWLAAIADWVVERPLEEAVKDVHHLAHGLDNELEKALDRLEHAADRGHMWPPSQAAPSRPGQSVENTCTHTASIPRNSEIDASAAASSTTARNMTTSPDKNERRT